MITGSSGKSQELGGHYEIDMVKTVKDLVLADRRE